MSVRQKMIVYNLFPLLAGRVTTWERHLRRAADMGFNWIFVNPIHRPGSSGSLYSIADYFSLNPLLVDPDGNGDGEKQVKDMVKTAEAMGLRLMVDLVINHCSVDSALLGSHPEWFVWESKGRVAHPFADENGKKVVWKDLAKFDHRHTRDPEGFFNYCLQIIEFLIGLGFKGFRCDAAYQLPKEVWERLIRKTKRKHADVVFFAETLGCKPDETRRTASAGFDFIFNSSKWWDFRGHWLMEQYNLTREVAPSISFPESHDTERLAEEVRGNLNALKQRYLFCALFSSGVMIPMGFEFGFRKKLHVVKTRPQDWEKTEIDLTDFISKVNRIKAKHAVFHEEAPTQVFHHNGVLTMWKASISTRDEGLLILNKDVSNKQPYHADSLQAFVLARAPFADISPENRLDYIPTPFSYDLNPGQGIVLITSRDPLED